MEFLKKFLRTLCISENDETTTRKRTVCDDNSDSSNQSNKKVKFEPIWKPQHSKQPSDDINHLETIKTKLTISNNDSEKEHVNISRIPSGLEDFVIVNE